MIHLVARRCCDRGPKACKHRDITVNDFPGESTFFQGARR